MIRSVSAAKDVCDLFVYPCPLISVHIAGLLYS